MKGDGSFSSAGDTDTPAIEDGISNQNLLRARRGRPRQISESERRLRLLEAAEGVFLELGYRSASMDDIAHRAGMSKKTVYRLFDTKESLFAAMIAARRAVLDAIIVDNSCSDDEDAGGILRTFLGKVARFVLAPRQAALYRLVIAESLRTPEIAHAFYDEGPCKVRAVLEQWLAQQHRRGVLIVADPERDAGMLCSMVIAELQMRLLVGELRAPDEALIDATVNRAVDLFLHGAAASEQKKSRTGTGVTVLYRPEVRYRFFLLDLRPDHAEGVSLWSIG